jgi:hypothetical protein
MCRRLTGLVVVCAAIAASGVAVGAAPAAGGPVRASLRRALSHGFPGLSKAQRAVLLAAAGRLRRAAQDRLARRLIAVSNRQVARGVAMLEAELAQLTRTRQRAVLDELIGALTREDRRIVDALALAASSSLQQFISTYAIASYNAFPGDVPALEQSCLSVSSEFSYYTKPSTAACTGGLTAANHAFLDRRFALTRGDSVRLVAHALDQAPAGLRAPLAARDVEFIRSNIAPGEFFLGTLALRRSRSDPQLEQAVAVSIDHCYTNADFYPCTDDEEQLALLGFAADGNGTLPLLPSLSQAFVDCLLSACTTDEETQVERYLVDEQERNKDLQFMLADMHKRTQEIGDAWILALGPGG